MKLLKDAVYKVRRAERKEAPELNRTRYLWLKKEHPLSTSQRRLRTQLLHSRRHLKTVRAYQFKLSFQDFWGLPPDQAPLLPRGAGAARSRTAASSPCHASLELWKSSLAATNPYRSLLP